MAVATRPADLQIDEDLGYQRREWLVQRWAWAAMALLIVAAMLGLFGHGVLSSRQAGSPDGGLLLEYQRFLQYHDPATLRLRATAGGDDGRNELRIWVDRDYLDQIEIQQVTPQPIRVEAGADRHVFVFRVMQDGGPTGVVIHFEPDAVGSLQARIGIGDLEPARFSQFCFP